MLNPKLRAYFEYVKRQPSLISGKVLESDVAHFSLPLRVVFPGRLPSIRWSGSGHHEVRGFFCLPLEPEYHRIEYPHSYHRLGQEAFLAHWGIPLEQVASRIAWQMADFFLNEWEG